MSSVKEESEIALSALVATFRKRQQVLEDREKELEKAITAFGKEKEQFGASIEDESSKQNDVLYLNVGGTVINVSRKTLTQVEGSMLASLFSGRWDDSIEKDRDGSFFINQPPELFLPLVDFCRDKLCETPSSLAVVSPASNDFTSWKKYTSFLRMVEYYGLTPGLYPCAIEIHSGLRESCEITDYPNLGVTATDWSVYTLKSKGHERGILGYEVKLGKVENFQLGWLHPTNWPANTSANATTKVGESPHSIGLDLCASGFLYGGTLSAVENLTVEEGDLIRCERKEGIVAWYVNGTRVNGQPAELPDDLRPSNCIDAAIPAFSGKGQWWIAKVDLNQA
jgi:BTB/POZ domain